MRWWEPSERSQIAATRRPFAAALMPNRKPSCPEPDKVWEVDHVWPWSVVEAVRTRYLAPSYSSQARVANRPSEEVTSRGVRESLPAAETAGPAAQVLPPSVDRAATMR